MGEGEFGREYGTVSLENDLRIEFYDQSRPIAGERRFVQLFIRIPIQPKQAYLADSDDPPHEWQFFLSQMREGLAFVQTKSRNFISLEDAPSLLERMKEEFLQANRGYLSHPSFAKMFVLKQYEEWKKSSAWQQAHRRLVAEIEQKERESE